MHVHDIVLSCDSFADKYRTKIVRINSFKTNTLSATSGFIMSTIQNYTNVIGLVESLIRLRHHIFFESRDTKIEKVVERL